jgi:hypothetical protein
VPSEEIAELFHPWPVIVSELKWEPADWRIWPSLRARHNNADQLMICRSIGK